MTWWPLAMWWVLSGTVAGLLTFGDFQWRYKGVASVREDASIAAFIGLLGPVGLLVVAFSDAVVTGWKYWRHGRKSRDEVFPPFPRFNIQVTGNLSPLPFFGVKAPGPEPAEPVEEFWTPEPVVAWRWWTLDVERLTLRGALMPWVTGVMHAEHAGGFVVLGGQDYTPHSGSPYPGCLCGVNALKAEYVYDYIRPNPLLLRLSPDPNVVGRVALTGVVDEYEKGYRAEKAEIIELVVLDDTMPLLSNEAIRGPILDALEARYGVRPTVQSRESWLAEMEVIHGYGKEDQADHLGAGTGAGQGTGQGASQDFLSACLNPWSALYMVPDDEEDDGLSGVTDA